MPGGALVVFWLVLMTAVAVGIGASRGLLGMPRVPVGLASSLRFSGAFLEAMPIRYLLQGWRLCCNGVGLVF